MSWRARRARVAPRDSRMAISLRRAVPRARSRLATLAQAISRTRPTTVIRSPPARTNTRRRPGLSAHWDRGKSVTFRPRFGSG